LGDLPTFRIPHYEFLIASMEAEADMLRTGWGRVQRFGWRKRSLSAAWGKARLEAGSGNRTGRPHRQVAMSDRMMGNKAR